MTKSMTYASTQVLIQWLYLAARGCKTYSLRVNTDYTHGRGSGGRLATYSTMSNLYGGLPICCHMRLMRAKCTLKPAHKGTARLRRIPAAVPQLPPHPCTNDPVKPLLLASASTKEDEAYH